jgi:hypothetical protein
MIALTIEQELKTLSILKSIMTFSIEDKISLAKDNEKHGKWYDAYVLYKHLNKTNDAKTMLRIVLSINMSDLYRKMINDINEKACDFLIDVHDKNDEEFNVYITKGCLRKHSELYHNLYCNCSETMDNAIDRIYQNALPLELRYKLAKSL